MGFLRRMLGGVATTSPDDSAPSWPPRGPITTWPIGEAFSGELKVHLFDPPGRRGTVEVVGESNYQGSLQVIAGGFDMNGPAVRDHIAVLLPEPTNPYDRNAVRVVIVPTQPGAKWGQVGGTCRGRTPSAIAP